MSEIKTWRKRMPLTNMTAVQSAMQSEIDELRAVNAMQAADIRNYLTTAMAAAVEIQEHWEAHCDAEGYGPANLMRRLENGFPASYGYTAKSFIEAQAENTHLKELLSQALGDLKSIQIYGADTLSGRTDGPDDRNWQREGVKEMTKRAFAAIQAIEKEGIK